MTTQPLVAQRISAWFSAGGMRAGASGARRPGLIPLVESLEKRIALSAFTWNGGGDKTSWTDANNWVSKGVPGGGDDVTISIGGNPTITLPSGGITVHSLTVTGDTLALAAGTITTTTGLTFSGGATFNFSGGSVSGPATLTNSTLNDGAGAGAATFTVAGNSALNGPITASQSLLLQSANLTLGVTASNGGTITLQPSSQNSAALTVAPAHRSSAPARSRSTRARASRARSRATLTTRASSTSAAPRGCTSPTRPRRSRRTSAGASPSPAPVPSSPATAGRSWSTAAPSAARSTPQTAPR